MKFPKLRQVEITAHDVVDQFRKSPAGQELLRKRAAEMFAERKALVKRLEQHRAAREIEAVALAKATTDAEARRAATHAAWLAACNEAAAAAGAQMGASIHDDNLVRQMEMELRDSADPAIAALIEELKAEIIPTYRLYDMREWKEDDGHWIRAKRDRNHASVDARVAALKAAIIRAEALQIAAVDDVDAEIAKIRSTVPLVNSIEYEPAA